MRKYLFVLLGFAAITLVGSPALAQIGPDVIVGDLQQVTSYGRVGDIYAYSVGTVSCNIGDEVLNWFANSNQHPVIGQALFRYQDGRMEQIGISWLKHGFCALSQSLCGQCQNTNCNTLGINCSDPYTAPRNGTQTNLGPRYQVNAHTGFYNWPFAFRGVSGNTIYKRVQVDRDFLDPALNPDSRYYVEGQYITPDDAAAGNGDNNVSYRRVNVGSNPNNYPLSFVSGNPTKRTIPALGAWKENQPDAIIQDVRVPGEGLLMLGHRVTDNEDGTWHYEYALYNMNSHSNAGSFSVPVPSSATLTNVEFHGVPYHSQEIWDSTPWTMERDTASVTWSTEIRSKNPNAFALRWSRMFNFRFDADSPPADVEVSVGIWRDESEILVNSEGPVELDLPNFVRGDVNADDSVDIADGIFALDALFANGDLPSCADAGDANDDGGFDVSDPIYLFNFLFTMGAEPPAPYGECGHDATADDLECISFDLCP